MTEGKPISLLVRNLRYTTSPKRVRQFFERFGKKDVKKFSFRNDPIRIVHVQCEVRNVYLPLDYYTKLPRGFGFVEFARKEDADAALDSVARRALLDGSEISATVAQEGRKSPDTMRARERQRGGGRRGRGDYGRDERYRKGRSHSTSRERYSGRYRSRSRSHNRDGGYRDGHYSNRYNNTDDRHCRTGEGRYNDDDENYRNNSRRRGSNDAYTNNHHVGDDRRERGKDRNGGHSRHHHESTTHRDHYRYPSGEERQSPPSPIRTS